ncbi:MAG: DUF4352 domain-containing protein, partial [Ktedonobacteraceae bacterium]|nr:DUF4352 domain-containing protein [Ktedonobacteraceae bacterium]
MPMPTPAPRKPRRWPWIVAILVALMIGYGTGRASAGDATTTQPVTTNTSAQPTAAQSQPTQQQQQPAGHHKVGDMVIADDTWQVKVTSVKTATHGENEFDQPKAGHIFVIINVEMKNISNETQSTSSLLMWTLRNTDGTEYDQDIFSGHSPNGKIEAGGNSKGSLVYEVPTNVKSFLLNFESGLGDSSLDVWNIAVK